jgi:hypothetical protein
MQDHISKSEEIRRHEKTMNGLQNTPGYNTTGATSAATELLTLPEQLSSISFILLLNI